MTSRDEQFMEIALRLGRRHMGMTGPNPSVGCVITRGQGGGEHIVGRGWTAAGGRPHAETQALARAGDRARGGTAYVSLEPCSHHGRTPPCAEALVEAGVARVVAALEDPDPRVSGAGFATLRASGLEVLVGPGAGSAERDLAGFITRQRRRRPYVVLKLAVSRDGKIALVRTGPTPITGPEARNHAHLLRARSDAIMIGSGTALADDPDLTCRLPGLHAASPERVVLDTSLRLSPTSVLAATARDVPVRVFCGPGAPHEHVAALSACGIDVHVLERAPSGLRGLQSVLARLADTGISRLLVEGGARLAGSLLDAALVDEIVIYRAASVLGSAAVDAVEGSDLDEILESGRFVLSETAECGEDLMQHYVKVA